MSKKNKPTNIRTCIVTNQKFNKQELIRMVVKDRKVYLDLEEKSLGRGYYIKPSLEILNMAIEKKILQRKLKTNIEKEFIDKLKQYCK